MSDKSAPETAPEPGEPLPNPDQAWKALSLVNEWIRHAETKAGVALTAAGVTGGVLYNLVKNQHDPTAFISVAAVICGALVFLAGLSASAALIPRRRIGKTGPTSDFNNHLFYSHIAAEFGDDEPTFAQVLGALTSNPTELTRHIAHQVHSNSLVAHQKYLWAARALTFVSGSLIVLALIAIVLGASNG